jgi:hypothetical protein
MAVTTHPLTGVFEADRTHSSFQFAVRHMKVSTFRASFGDVDARLIADASEPRLEGTARVESISIADPPEFREHVVRSADFFDADNHPEILFRARDPPRLGPERAGAPGGLGRRGRLLVPRLEQVEPRTDRRRARGCAEMSMFWFEDVESARDLAKLDRESTAVSASSSSEANGAGSAMVERFAAAFEASTRIPPARGVDSSRPQPRKRRPPDVVTPASVQCGPAG